MLPADILCRSHGYASEPGTFIAIIGPSGVGKDSLIAGARQVFRHSPAFHFARRVITREPDSTEDHVPVSIEDFLSLERDGKFSLSWQANGLGYGLPLTVHDDLARGNNVVANIRERWCRKCARDFFGRWSSMSRLNRI